VEVLENGKVIIILYLIDKLDKDWFGTFSRNGFNDCTSLYCGMCANAYARKAGNS
jgi:hypothetical protein